MLLIKKIKKALANHRLLGIYLLSKLAVLFPDKLYLKLMFRLKMGYWIDFDNPQTFNEKLNWLKIYNRNPEFTIMADKFLVKDYVTEKIGSQYVVPCYARYHRFEDMDFNELPNQFAIKMTHNSSGVFIVKDKSNIDKLKLARFIEQYFDYNYYWYLREWPYKNIFPSIIAEQLLEDKTGDVLMDYKFWCFNGVPLYMYCTVKGVKEVYENFYDMDFAPVDINHGYPRHSPEFSKPKSFETMKELATILSQGIPFVRVDFYEINGHPYFGEFTFYDWGGMRPFVNKQQDLELGKLITLLDE